MRPIKFTTDIYGRATKVVIVRDGQAPPSEVTSNWASFPGLTLWMLSAPVQDAPVSAQEPLQSVDNALDTSEGGDGR